MSSAGLEPAVPKIEQTHALRTRGHRDQLRYVCGIMTCAFVVSVFRISLSKQLDFHKARYKCHFTILRHHPVHINNNKMKIIAVYFSGVSAASFLFSFAVYWTRSVSSAHSIWDNHNALFLVVTTHNVTTTLPFHLSRLAIASTRTSPKWRLSNLTVHQKLKFAYAANQLSMKINGCKWIYWDIKSLVLSNSKCRKKKDGLLKGMKD